MKKCVVKIIDTLFPFYCRGCGKAGGLLCDRCRKNTVCGLRFCGSDKDVEIGFLKGLYAVGWREGVLKQLVEDYKFKSARRVSQVLGELLDDVLPNGLRGNAELLSDDLRDSALQDDLRGRDVVVVPLPTISRHVRERGFDHTYKLALEFAKVRGLKVERVLKRVNKAVQVGADEEVREKQAKGAYEVDEKLFDGNKCYLLVDDVWTTGASMRAAAERLAEKGAKEIYGAIIEMGR